MRNNASFGEKAFAASQFSKEREYWVNKLSGDPVKSSFSLDSERKKAQPRAERDSLEFKMTGELYEKLQKLSLGSDHSLFIILTSVIVLLLHKYTDHGDILVGTTIYRQDIEGDFVNTILVLRNEISAGMTFKELLLRVKQTAAEANEHQNFPIETLLYQLDLPFSEENFPLFDVAILLENIQDRNYLHPIKPNMLFTFKRTADLLSGVIEYNASVFEDDRVKRLTGHIQQVMRRVLADVDLQICDLEILTGKERQQILYNFNDTGKDYPADKTLDRLFAEQAEKTPAGIALFGIGQNIGAKHLAPIQNGNASPLQSRQSVHLTYRELDRETGRLARVLSEKGVTPGIIAGLLLERSLEMISGILAILKTGSAYLPIGPQYPRERIAYMLQDSNTPALVTSRSLFNEDDKFSGLKVETLFIEDCRGEPGVRPSGKTGVGARRAVPSKPATCNLQPVSSPSNLAYLIYTSGSTGKPKGVPVAHRSAVNVVTWFAGKYNLAPGFRVLQMSEYTFDASVNQVFGTLLHGAELHIIERDLLFDVAALRQYINDKGINMAYFVPLLLKELLCYGEKLPSLKVVVTGGDKLEENMKDGILKKGYRLYNQYGPTEAAVDTLASTCSQAKVNLGTPIANAKCYILDRYLKLLPIGITGELFIAGTGLARGYLNQPELTAEKFIKAQAASRKPQAQARTHQLTNSSTHSLVYRTGDLARWQPDGNIEFLGRLDFQVKIRGFRIELGEIENELLKHESIEEAVVIDRQAENGDKYLCAYLVTKRKEQNAEPVGANLVFAREPDEEITPVGANLVFAPDLDRAELREFLSRTLPDYMIPSYFIEIEKIPLNLVGKIDRSALPEPGLVQGIEGYIPPGSRAAAQVAEVWQQVLGVDKIGIADNFFEVGGDSIKAIQIAARLKKYRLDLGINDLFLYPTIKELEKHGCLKEYDREIDQGEVSGQVYLTPIQVSFFEKNHNCLHHYNQSVMLYRAEGFAEVILEEVLTRIVKHHDALRMVYETGDNKIIQVNRNSRGKGFDFKVFDFREQKDIEKKIKKEADTLQGSIDLSKGPLLKSALFKTLSGDHLLIIIHHLVVDGISWRILLEDIDTAYSQLSRGEQIRLPLKTDPFKYWSEKLRYYAAGDTSAAADKVLNELTYWDELDRVPVAPLPRDTEIAVEKKKIKYMEAVNLELDQKETDDLLKRVNRPYNTEINDILLCALGLTIKDWAGREKILVSLEGHGREAIIKGVDISRTVGWFTTRFPVLLDMGKNGDISYEIRNVKETLRRIPNKGFGYGILRYLAAADQKKGYTFKLAPEINFNYLGHFGRQGDKQDKSGAGSLQFSKMNPGAGRSPEFEQAYVLDIGGMLVDGKLNLSFSYNRYEFKKNSIEELAGRYRSNLLSIINHCKTRREKLPTPADFGWPYISIENLAEITSHIGDKIGKKAKIQSIYPLSPMQRGMLFHSLRSKESHAYFQQTLFNFKGQIEKDLLEDALNRIIERYDVLRTIFIHEGLPEPLQVVLESRKVNVYYDSIEHLSEAEKEKYIEGFREQDRDSGFDLSWQPLVRFSLIKAAAENFKLVWSFSHILMDGWCLGVIYKDLIQIYLSIKEGTTAALQEAPPYRHYIDWLRRQDMEAGLGYWQEYLGGYSQQAGLPHSIILAEDDDAYELAEYNMVIDEDLSGKLDRIGKQNRVTTNTMFQTLWGILLQKYNNTEDVVFGAVVSGRPAEIEGIEDMIGLFINTTPVRIRARAGGKFPGFLRRVQEEAVSLRSFEYLPLSEIQLVSQLKRNLIDHIMIFENYPIQKAVADGSTGKNPGFTVENAEVFEQTNYHFNIAVIPGQTIGIRFSYNALVYESEKIEKLAGHFNRVIEQVVNNPEIPVDEIEIVTLEEKRQILWDFNDTEVDYENDKMLRQLFAEQVARTPDHIVLIGMSHNVGAKHSVLRQDGNASPLPLPLTHLTYRELNRDANQLALLLIEKGVGPGIIAALMTGRSLEMIISLLAILKTGGAYLPIDPEYPQQRKDYILRDSSAKVLLTTRSIYEEVEKLRSLEVERIFIEDCRGEPCVRPSGTNAVGARRAVPFEIPYLGFIGAAPRMAAGRGGLESGSPAGLAYVIYTSGSTGNPKGVAITQRNVVNFIKGMTGMIDFSPGKTILALTTISFDIFVLETILPLMHCLKIFMAGEEEQRDPAALRNLILKNRVQMLQVTPSRLKLLMSSDEELACLKDVAELMVGGEAFPDNLIALVKEKFRGKIYNMYGPTETTVWSAVKDLTGIAEINIGRPVANTQIYILDRSYKLQPIGITGELCIAGDGLGRGYLNQPELTAEKFITAQAASRKPQAQARTHQLTNSPTHSLVYRTGDLARWLPAGEIEFLGRIDFQVKIRGFRIELEEIENRLLQREDIKEAVVTANTDEAGDSYLCAYIVTHSTKPVGANLVFARDSNKDAEPVGANLVFARDSNRDAEPVGANLVFAREPDEEGTPVGSDLVSAREPDQAELRKYLSQTMPDYMVPSYFMQLQKIPLTPNGKVDRKALPEPEAVSSETYTAPGDKLEEQLVRIWSEVLKIDAASVGIDDNFFDLGGHSLKATRLIYHIQKELQVEIELKEIFSFPTIRELAGIVRDASPLEYTEIEAVEEKENYDLSYAQRRLWILCQFEEDSAAYNMPTAAVLSGRLNKKAFNRAFQTLTDRHESLRTTFLTIAGEPRQKIIKDFKFAPELVDLRKLEEKAKEEEARKIYRETIQHAFDLEKGPLFKVKLVRLDAEKFLFIFNIHHIINDGWSLGNISNELLILYNRYCMANLEKETNGHLPEITLQYKDYALWHNDLINRGSFNQREAYWLEKFKDKPNGIELPLDYTRKPIQTFNGDRIVFSLGKEKTRQLSRLGSEYEATLFMTMLALLSVFLYKYSGQRDIILGAPIAGRRKPELHDMIGFLVNTLVYRNEVDPGSTFKELLQGVRQETLQAFENQDYPFDLLIENLELDRDMSQSPLFNVMLAYNNAETIDTTLSLAGLEVFSYAHLHDFNMSKFDLIFFMGEFGDELFVNIEYNSDLFRRSTIRRMVENFRVLAVEVLEKRENPIYNLNLIAGEEYEQVIYGFNDNNHEFAGLTLQEKFEKQAAGNPDRTAVVGITPPQEDGSSAVGARRAVPSISESPIITYGDLNRRANQFARYLREEYRVKPNHVVGISVDRSIDMIIVLLGIIKSGAAYLAVDPTYPQERVLHVLADSRADLLVIDRMRPELFGDYEGKILDINENRERIALNSPENPAVVNQPADILYVNYTSGSTGTPNGAILSHDILTNMINWQNEKTTIDCSLRCLQFTSINFCVSFQEILGTLTSGGELHLIGDIERQDIDYLMDFLSEHRVEILFLPFSYLNFLFNESSRWDKTFKHNLKHIITAGEQLKITAGLKRFLDLNPGLQLHNHYGSTEMHVVTSYTLDASTAARTPIPPAGKPINNVKIYILDEFHNPVPIGVWGELCVKGSSQVLGYIHDKDLTEKKILRHKELSSDGIGLYKSGDIGRWGEDGNIELRGRKDFQVKIRGFRVEPGEVESKILSIDQVRECVVVVKEDARGQNFLVAYVAADGIDVLEIKKSVAADLPQYMVPHLMILDSLPLMPNGKVDRESLPEPELAAEEIYTAPADEIEERLAEIWSAVLGIDKQSIGIDANFFELGGHSLKATSMAAKIHKQLNRRIPLTEVFKAPTIRELAAYLKGLAEFKYAALQPAVKKETYRLSSAQKRLFILQQMEAGNIGYNLPIVVLLEGKIDKDKIEATFRKLIDRHESLRTSFTVLKDEPAQRIHRPEEIKLEIEYHKSNSSQQAPGKKGRGEPCVRPSGINAVGARRAVPCEIPSHGFIGAAPRMPAGRGGSESPNHSSLIIHHSLSKFLRPFNLSRAPLMRVGLVELAEQEHILMVDMHHIIADGISLGILTGEFMKLYAGQDLPRMRLQYKDYSEWQNSDEVRAEILKQEDFWKRHFCGEIPLLDLPADYVRPAVQSFAGRKIYFDFGIDESAGLNKIAIDQGCTLFMVLFALFNVLLAKISGQDDIVVGTSTAGRSHTELEQVFGMFVNTMGIRNYPGGEKTFKEFLADVKARILEAFENQDVQFEDLVEKLAVKRDAGRNPLFDVMFALQNMEIAEVTVPGLKLRSCEYETGMAKFDLGLQAYESKERILCSLEYCIKIFKAETVERFIGFFKKIVSSILKNPGTRISVVEILSEQERRDILFDFNDTATGYPGEKTINLLFEEQAVSFPDSSALVFKDRQVTYKELNIRANRLARILRAKGVAPGSIVGLFIERSIDMMVGIFGILKAGGAYLPITPDTPVNRFSSMLQDCRAAILLTGGDVSKSHSFTRLQDLQLTELEPCVTQRRQQILDFDNFPIPDRSLVDYEAYNRFISQAMVKNAISIQATRGCPYNCAYCHKLWPKNHVVRSAENIFAEVQLYYNMGVRRFAFIDDIFNLDRENSERFFNLVLEKGLDIQIFFPNGVRADILTEEYIDLMVKAGTVNVAFALETASPRIQKLIRKNLRLEKFRANTEYMARKYPHVILELFTMHGFPSETEAEAEETLNFIKSIKWLHFPYVFILKVYPKTDMAKLAVANGVTPAAIARSEDLLFHELPDTLPFKKNFTLNYQADFFNNYFLSKERLLKVLPYQMKILTEDEILQKYNSYLPKEILTLAELLEFFGITAEELGGAVHPAEEKELPGFNEKTRKHFPAEKPAKNALRILLLDLSQHFSESKDQLRVLLEAPLGLMYIMTYINQCFGSSVNGRIAKAQIDFDNYRELKLLLEEFKPDVIGMRTLSFYKNFLHRTAAMIRQWGIGSPIIVGGPYGTSAYEMLLQDKNIDLVVLGEGEITFAELVQAIIKNGGKLPGEEVLREIKGIAFIPQAEKEKDRWGREILMFETLPDSLPPAAAVNLPHVNRSADPAYVIFTSGTTGKPRGNLTTHYNVVRVVKDTNYIELNKDDRILQLSNYAFDGSVFDIYGALLNGSALILLDREEVITIEKLSRLIRDKNVTLFFVTTALFNTLVDLDISCLKNVRKILFGGERVSVEHSRKALKYLGKDRVMHVYGPTETTVYASYYDINTIEEDAVTIPIGSPLANTTIYILDEYFNPLPVGLKGEVYIGGDGLARGYLNSPEFTAERFITAQAGTHQLTHSSTHSLVYRTGDLARWLPGGHVEFLGRIDQQVKIRGFRIELGEIENQLLNRDEIKEAVVLDRTAACGENYLCAYIVLRDRGEITEISVFIDEIKRYLARDLPEYMIPPFYVILEELPLTPNGKVDRRALPEPVAGKTGVEFTAPRNELERKLAGTWSRVLGIAREKISIDADFFELGGHSLKATALISRVHKELQVKIPLGNIFENPTIRALSSFVQDAVKKEFAAVEAAEQREYYPLSSAQRRLYVLQQMDPRSSAYNMPIVVKLSGELDTKRMEHTFLELIKRHEILRTAFITIKPSAAAADRPVENEPVQKIHRPEDIKFEIEYYEMDKMQEASGIREKQGSTENGVGAQRAVPSDQECRGEPCVRPSGEITVGARRAVPSEHATCNSQTAASTINLFLRPFALTLAPLLRVGLIKIAEKEHILMVDSHHIISDGVSQGIIIRDFMHLYIGEELHPLRLQYTAYSQWQNSERQQAAVKQQEKFWLREFAGEIPVLHLPADYPRPPVYNFAGSHKGFEIGAAAAAALRKLALNQGVTMYMISFALFNIFLWKLSSQEDIVIGTPVAGRSHADLEKIIGMFVNTLAIRNKLQPGKSFAEFLKDVESLTIAAFENQDYQYEDLVNKVSGSLERDMSRNPLFDVTFALQDNDTSAVEIPGLQILPYEFENKTAKFDLTLIGKDAGEKIFFIFEFCTQLFKSETIDRFSDYFKKIVSGVTAEPGIKLWEIDMIPPAEKERILYEFNDTKVAYHQEKTVHGLFAEQVEKTPDNIALIGPEHGQRRTEQTVGVGAKHLAPGQNGNASPQQYQQSVHLTYWQLNEKADRLARILAGRSVRPGDIVGLMVERSIEMIIGLMAILKTGAAYLPLDPGYPEERTRFMLTDSSAGLLLTCRWGKKEVEKFSSLEVETAFIEDCRGEALPFCPGNECFAPTGVRPSGTNAVGARRAVPSEPATCSLQPVTSPLNLAYIIYTSGSSGRAKGVAVEHCSIVNTLLWFKNYYSFSRDDANMQIPSFAFDSSVEDIFATLISGAKLILLQQQEKNNLEYLQQVLQKEKVTHFLIVPGLYKAFLEGIHESLKNVKAVTLAGEGFTEELVKEHFSKLSRVKLYNEYGPTENSVCTSVYEFSEDKMEVLIGKPIDNVRCYILNKYGNLNPIGIPGELYTTGRGISRGYLNRPELTAEKFVDFASGRQGAFLKNRPLHPQKTFDNEQCRRGEPCVPPQNLLYKTGDLTRWLPDGNMEFLGRIDFQVKIRGFRIELGEIENELLKHKYLKEAVVIDRQSDKGDKYLCAYIVAQSADPVGANLVFAREPDEEIPPAGAHPVSGPGTANMPDTAELRGLLSQNLPHYMIPAYFVFLEKMPLTPNGKVDRKALPAPGGFAQSGGFDYAPPRNEIEEKLVEIYEEVLGRKPVAVNDNFFLIGGDSIKSIQVASRLTGFGYKIEVKDIFQYPEISELALRVRQIGSADNEADQSPVTGVVPLTPIQADFFGKPAPERHHFNQSVMLYAAAGFAEEAVRAVFSKIIEHHDALRMCYPLEKGAVVQTNRGLDLPLSLQVFDLRSQDEKDSMNKTLAALADKIQASIDLEKGPLMKLGLFRLPDGDRLLIVIHHLVIDGISWRVLFEDIETLYRQYQQGEELTLPPKTSSFKSYAEKLLHYSREFQKNSDDLASGGQPHMRGEAFRVLQSKNIAAYGFGIPIQGHSGSPRRGVEKSWRTSIKTFRSREEGSLSAERVYWEELVSRAQQVPVIKRDYDNESSYIKDGRVLSFNLSEVETDNLLTKTNRAFGTEINDILLTALGLSIKETFGHDKVLIDLEGHGRQEIFAGLDIGRTIGWFTTVYPVILAAAYDRNLSRQIKEVKENLRQVPNKGIGYGILKYLSVREKQQLIDLTPGPQVLFNYLGQFDADIEQRFFKMAAESQGNSISPERERDYDFNVSGIVSGKVLKISISFSQKQYRQETIRELIDNYKAQLQKLIAFCLTREEKELTPADLTYKELSIETLDKLTGQYPLEDIYPLSPMQEGMLFHALYDTLSSSYFEQVSFRVTGDFEPSLVEKSLNELFKRHHILRTLFVHEDLDRPLQVVLKDRQVEFYYEDISEKLSPQEKERFIREFKTKDRERSFDLSRDVLMRVAMIRLNRMEYEFTWSIHHILIDGWSSIILISEYFEIYNSYLENRQYRLPRLTPYRAYIEWLEAQDKEEGRQFWQDYLAGYEQPPCLSGFRCREKSAEYQLAEYHLVIDETLTEALTRAAKEQRVTLNILFQALWAVLLHKYNNSGDVLFGAVVSGRPPEVPGIEQMIGLFINTVPVRMRIAAGQSFPRLLEEMRQSSLQAGQYEYLPLAEIQANSSLKEGAIDHILVFQNFPLTSGSEGKADAAARQVLPGLKQAEVYAPTNYDFNITVDPGAELRLRFKYNALVFEQEFVVEVARQLKKIMAQVTGNGLVKLSEIEILSHREKEEMLSQLSADLESESG